jgi:hypothetical protein
MKYLRAYKYLFDSPNWGLNLLFGSVCIFIPAIGGILLSGYGFEVLEAMHERKGDDKYPDFDFNRFVKYLLRGLWPFIWQLIIGLPIGFLAGGFYVVFMVIVAAVGGREPNPGAFVAGLICFFVVFFLLGFLVAIIQIPLILRAGLSQEFVFSGALEFLQDFLKRVWVETILSQLFIMGTGLVLVLVGELLCCLPAYPATVLVVMANFHLLYQLYELYLQRGGTPIPVKLEEAGE